MSSNAPAPAPTRSNLSAAIQASNSPTSNSVSSFPFSEQQQQQQQRPGHSTVLSQPHPQPHPQPLQQHTQQQHTQNNDYFVRLAVSKEPLRWTPTQNSTSNSTSNSTVIPANPSNPQNQQHQNTFNQSSLPRSRTASGRDFTQKQSNFFASNHPIQSPPPSNWGPPPSSLPKQYTSINNYQPSSSWIAPGWGALVEGKNPQQPYSPSLPTRSAVGTPAQERNEWPIQNTYTTEWTTSEWRNPNAPNQDGTPEWGSPKLNGTNGGDEWGAINSTTAIAASYPNSFFTTNQHQYQNNNTNNSQPNNNGYPSTSYNPSQNQIYPTSPSLPHIENLALHSQTNQQQQPPGSPLPSTPSSPPPPFELVGNGRWKVTELIGAGSFGEVFGAIDMETGSHVAIKREIRNSRKQQLPHEAMVYDLLKKQEGFPRIFFSGPEGPYNILVMERLGPSLKSLLTLSPLQKIPLRTIVHITPHLLRRLETLHSIGILFRDIKPDQFCIGRYNTPITDRPTPYLIDFGLATAYRDHQGRHIKNPKPIKNAPKTGTARYASLNVHKGKTHSRRDDLESLAYMLIECVKGPLPWTGIKAVTSTDGWRKIGICKDDLPIAELCDGLPKEFAGLLEHARELRFADDPDYGMLIHSFVDLMVRLDEEGTGLKEEGLVWTVESEGDDGYGPK